MSLKKTYKLYRNYFCDYLETQKYQVRCFNVATYDFNSYTSQKDTLNNWLSRFLVNRMKISKLTNKTIAIFGVNGFRETIKLDRSDYKIFYTVENVHDEGSHWKQFEDLLIPEKRVNLSLGFDYIENEKYLRFPFWLMANFMPESTVDDIQQKLESYQKTKIDKEKFCAFICRNLYSGGRQQFYDIVNSIESVSCPSNFMHNDNTLHTEYNNNKREYLQNFKFNLCPENSNYSGLVTEKLFDAVFAGCIPIYNGADNQPEPEILNQNRILFLKSNDNNDFILQKIKLLLTDSEQFYNFANQPAFTPDAAKIIYGYFENLEKKILEMLK